MTTQTTQNLLFTEHLTWLNTLVQIKNLYKDFELKLQLSAVGIANAIVLAKVESFQNRCIRQKEVLDELRHEIKQHENHLERMDQPAHLLLLMHVNLRDQYNRFFDLYLELERDFDEYIA
jgi:hypothetical protein